MLSYASAGRLFDFRAPLRANGTVVLERVTDGLLSGPNDLSEPPLRAQFLDDALERDGASGIHGSNSYKNACPMSTRISVLRCNKFPCSFGTMKSIGDRVKKARQAEGLSMVDLANALGVKYQTIQQLENGTSKGTTHIVGIAKALRRRPEWLQYGEGPEFAEREPTVPVVGEVGAGAEIHPFDDSPLGEGLEQVPAPPGAYDCIAVRVRGNSQYPVIQDGWLLFYTRDVHGVPEEAIGKLCIVCVKDGPTMVKTVRRGSKRGLWRLESWNAEPIENVKLVWASPVKFYGIP